MKNTKKLTLSVLPEKLGVCHLAKNSPIPPWASTVAFCSITRTKDELSIVCPQEEIPGGILAEKDWRAFKVEGPLGFTLTGVTSSLSAPLAKAEISILPISTYETDYILLKEENLQKAIDILSNICNIQKQ